MKDLIIVGAGGMGRKLFPFLRELNDGRWQMQGFIDDDLHALDGIRCDLSIIGTISEWKPQENQVFAMGISSPHTKKIVAEKLLSRGAKFETIVSKQAILGDYVEIGEGSVILTPYNIECGARIGCFVTILGSTIALDGEIGDYSTSTGFANLTNAKIGQEVYIGSHAVILENLKVGDRAFISVGSVVMQDVEADTQVFGYPARVVRRK